MSAPKPGQLVRVISRDGMDNIAKSYLAFYDAYNKEWVSADRGRIVGKIETWPETQPVVVLELPDPQATLAALAAGAASAAWVSNAQVLLPEVMRQISRQVGHPRMDEPKAWKVVRAKAQGFTGPVDWLHKDDGKWYPVHENILVTSCGWTDLIDPEPVS